MSSPTAPEVRSQWILFLVGDKFKKFPELPRLPWGQIQVRLRPGLPSQTSGWADVADSIPPGFLFEGRLSEKPGRGQVIQTKLGDTVHRQACQVWQVFLVVTVFN